VSGAAERPVQYPFSYISATRGQIPPPTTRSHEPQTLMVEWTGGYANFYEKALFVKTSWRLRCVVNATALPFALCFYPHSQ
jgi:hypothetical protein